MGNSYMKQHLDTATKTGVLRISYKKLNEVPENMKQLSKVLRTLDMSSNKFAIIPSWIGDFKLLKHLAVNDCRITSLPDEIGELIKLETLSFNTNRITELPDTISKLKNLKRVDFSNNKLTVFPKCFTNLKHLDVIDLTKNEITEITDEAVENLNVIELIVNQNQINSVSIKICQCPRLKTLRLEENCIQLQNVIPLLKESNVSLLALEGNLFDSKALTHAEGYEDYQARYTAVKKKLF